MRAAVKEEDGIMRKILYALSSSVIGLSLAEIMPYFTESGSDPTTVKVQFVAE
jgi:hypothetical protein